MIKPLIYTAALGAASIGAANSYRKYKYGSFEQSDRGGFILPSAVNAYSQLISGDNALTNLAAGIGLGWAGNKIMASGLGSMRKAASSVTGVEADVTGIIRRQPGAKASLSRDPMTKLLFSNKKAKNIPRMVRKATGGAIGSVRANSALGAIAGSDVGLSRLKMGASVRRLASIAMWMPIAGSAFDAVTSAYDLAPSAAPTRMKPTTNLGGTFMDTDIAYTQRRRALQVMHNSQYSGRAALGNEASILHS